MTLHSRQAIMTTEIPGALSSPVHQHLPFLLKLVEPGLYFLHNYVWSDAGSENDFAALLGVGRLIWEVARQDPSVMQRFSSSHHTSEVCMQPRQSCLSLNLHWILKKSTHEYTAARVWNILTVAALMEPSATWSAMLFTQLRNCSHAHRTALRLRGQSGGMSVEPSTADVNHAYITVKLWVILAQMSVDSQGSSVTPFVVWNELWPPFESLLNALESEARTGLSLVSMTVTDGANGN